MAEEPARTLLNVPEEILAQRFHRLGSPLSPSAAIAFSGCCKTLHAMLQLRRAAASLKAEHSRARSR